MVQLTSALVPLGVAASLVDLILSLTPYSRALEERIPRNDHAFPCLARIPCCGCGGSCTPLGTRKKDQALRGGIEGKSWVCKMLHMAVKIQQGPPLEAQTRGRRA